MANGDFEVARAYVTIVPTLEGAQASITKDLTGVTDEASESAGESGGKKFGEKFGTALKATAATITAAMAAVTAGAVAAGKEFISAANDVAEYGDHVDKMSQKLNLSAQGYQELDFIFQHAGTSIDKMGGSIKTLSTQLEKGGDAFAALGLDVEQLGNMSSEELFMTTIESLQGVEDETQRMYLASQLLGKGATELGPIFNMTSDELEEMRAQYHELNGGLSDEAVQSAAAYQDALLDMQTAITGLKNKTMSEFLPGMTAVMNGMAKVFSGQDGGLEEIQSGLGTVISKISEIAPKFLELGKTLILSLIEGFAPMVPELISTIFSVLVTALTTITSMMPQLLPVIEQGLEGIMSATMDALPIIFDGLITLITDLVLWLAEGDRIQMFITGILQLVASLVERFGEILPVLLPAIVHIISEIVQALTEPDTVQMLIEAVLYLIGAIVMALVESLPEIGGLVYETIMNLSELLARFFEWAVPIVSEFIGNVVDLVVGLGSQIGEWFSNLWTNAKEKVGNLITNIVEIIKGLPGKVVDIGKNLVEGLWDGISGAAGWLTDKIGGFCDGVVDSVCGFFDIFSPSHVMRDLVGANLALGIGVGFEGEMDTVSDDMVSSMDGLTDAMTADVSAYNNTGAALADDTTTINSGNNTFNIYASEGMDTEELAQQISEKIAQQTRRKEAAYA